MDFAVPEAISHAIQQRLNHPVFGYSFRTGSYIESIQSWLRTRFDWPIEKNDLLFYPPGTVAAINCLVNLFTKPGDEIIVHTPAYPPLMNIVRQNKRVLVESPLVKIDSEYQLNEEQFNASFNSKTKMLILCSPHNPTGRVWSQQELETIARICQQKNVIVISDEVHADLVFPSVKHCHFNRLEKAIRPKSVTIISSCKTFNVAALSQSTLICDDPELKRKIKWAINTSQLNLDNIFAAVAAEAGYTHSANWVDELMAYIENNKRFIHGFLAKELPKVELTRSQGTYLAWLDFRQLGISHNELARIFVERAGVGLYDGRLFGDCGEGYFRINMACSQAILQLAMEKIAAALNNQLI